MLVLSPVDYLSYTQFQRSASRQMFGSTIVEVALIKHYGALQLLAVNRSAQCCRDSELVEG